MEFKINFSVLSASDGLKRAATARLWLAAVLLYWLCAGPARAADRQFLAQRLPAAATNAAPLRHSSRWTKLNLGLSLPLRNREALTNLLQQLYDPRSANFRHYLTPEQFTQKFGPTEEDYQSVVNFARQHGFSVTATHSNRTLVSVRGTVADIERAFHVSLNDYQHPTENRVFYAPDSAPSVDLATPLLGVSGLDNFTAAHTCVKTAAPIEPGQPLLGSGPGGNYIGNDFRTAYVPGVTLTGTGQIVGLFELNDGFYQSDITAYETLAGLPNVPVTTVLLDGYNGGPGSANGNAEVSLDIEMAISMAPGLSEVIVYEGSTPDDVLSRMASDNLAKQMAASYTYPVDAESDQLFQQMAMQGQSFFNASGDSDAYTGQPLSPTGDPNITIVGGTTLATAGAGGAWSSETTWNDGGVLGTGGGFNPEAPIPSWQLPVNMSANQGSTNYRNLPDVAITATNILATLGNGSEDSLVGTSCSVQLWAAYTALVNQLAVSNNEPTVGFINPAIYAMGLGSNSAPYTTLFHDITTGNNESPNSPSKYVAVAGYDLCTGWGSPNGSNLILALALPEPLRVTPLSGLLFSGPVGGPFTPAVQSYTLTNNGIGSFNWSTANTSSVFTVSVTSGALAKGGPAETVSLSAASSDTNLPAGSYSVDLSFTNLGDNFVQTRQVTLDIVTPPLITSQPTNESSLQGAAATFSVGTAANSLILYQWKRNGANLTDGGVFSGSATSNLTISSVQSANTGTYSVVLSNVAGSVVSSNATLSILASKPVFVLQPASQTVLPGSPVAFSVTVVGTTPYTYSWQLNGKTVANDAPYSGAASSNLSISFATAAQAGTYTAIAANSLGSNVSAPAVLSLLPVSVSGLSLSTLWSFTGGADGAEPYCPLVQGSDNNLYGTATAGGAGSDGTIYKTTTNGILTTVHGFTGPTSDGSVPYAGLCLSQNGFFYGATFTGGTYNDGAFFRFIVGGTPANLPSLNGNDGEGIVAGLVQGGDGNLYGTTYEGGAYGYGSIFRMTATGVLTTLVSFDNVIGSEPSPVLAIGRDGSLYGTTEEGGYYGGGTVFKMTLAGQFTELHSFTGGSDGAIPVAGVVQAADGNFYGTSYEYGDYGYGAVYEITSSGALTPRYSFTGGADGGAPWGGLFAAADGNLYGTTQEGGTYGSGTVFQLAPAGGFVTVAQFDGFNGGDPSGSLMQAKDGGLYGTTVGGGVNKDGAIYRLGISGPLQITGQPADASVYSGGTASFTVATFGGGPVSYQWMQNGINLTNGAGISGANAATLVISNASYLNPADYSVVVSNSLNSLTSQEATLEVIYSPPLITAEPFSQTVVAGMTAIFTVTAAGDQALSYQWQEDGTNLTDGGALAGSSTSTLTISNVAFTNAGTYSVIVSNPIYDAASSGATLTVIPAASAGAASSTVHIFAGGISDGAFPYSSLAEGNDGNLYGMTEGGGSQYAGGIFRLTLAGTLSTLDSFTPNSTSSGSFPYGGFVLGTNGNLFGTTSAGGKVGDGSVFYLTPGTGGVKYIYNFDDTADGDAPLGTMIEGSDGRFYGTAESGGSNGYGSVFAVTVAGKLTPLYGFTAGADGAEPYAGVIQGSDGSFYGTTLEDGAGGYGTVYKLNTNGALTVLASLAGENGAYLLAGVIQGRDGNLYGAAFEGGTYGYGTVFSVTTNGALTTLHSFNLTDGANPAATLVQGTDGNFYGTTSAAGMGGQGTAFRITTNGTFTTLISFDGFNGADPEAAMIQAGDGNFYGTANQGGVGFNQSAGGGDGAIFKLTVPIFITNTITAAPAIAGLPYAAGISNFAVAPAGDALSFGLVSGPVWLQVAANGLLSGSPSAANIGTNNFVVSLTDTNGVTAAANLVISVSPDPAPVFLSNPFAEAGGIAGQAYSANIATNATDAEIGNGDILGFAEVSGPSWLTVAANGALSGTPELANAGTNIFVVSVTNLGGASNTATIFINVNLAPPAPFVAQMAMQGASLLLSWSGGMGPYQLLMTTNLNQPNWQPVGGPINGTNLVIVPTNAAAYYQIQGQ